MSSELSQVSDSSVNSEIPVEDSNRTKSTARKLLKFAGAWKGDDLEECLEEVYKTRGETTFS